MHVHVQKTDEEKQAGFYKTEQCVLSNMYILWNIFIFHHEYTL